MRPIIFMIVLVARTCHDPIRFELELIQTQMAQKPMLRAEVLASTNANLNSQPGTSLRAPAFLVLRTPVLLFFLMVSRPFLITRLLYILVVVSIPAPAMILGGHSRLQNTEFSRGTFLKEKDVRVLPRSYRRCTESRDSPPVKKDRFAGSCSN